MRDNCIPDLPDEEWRELDGWDGIYQISSLGRLKSIDRYVTTKHTKPRAVFHAGRLLVQCDNGCGHLCVNLGPECNSKAVSRLVAKTFLRNPLNKSQVNHINGNTRDNRVSNLEWVTNSENMMHSTRVLGHKRFEDHNQAKLTRESVEDMKILRAFGATYSALAECYHVSRRAASNAINGKSWVALPYTKPITE